MGMWKSYGVETGSQDRGATLERVNQTLAMLRDYEGAFAGRLPMSCPSQTPIVRPQRPSLPHEFQGDQSNLVLGRPMTLDLKSTLRSIGFSG